MKVLLLSCSPNGEIDEVSSLLTKSLCARKEQLLYKKNAPAAHRFIKQKASFAHLNVNLNDYDLIVLGIETLDGAYVKALHDIFEKQGINPKKIAYYYLDEQRAHFAHRNLLKTLKGNQIIGSLAIKDIANNYHKYVIPMVQWANNIVSKCV